MSKSDAKKYISALDVLIVKALLISGIVLSMLSIVQYANAQIVEPGFASEVVTENLSLATGLAFTPDGRIFIAEKGGAIKVVKDGVLLSEPLVILTDVNTFGDRGLIGLAVDPNFINNGYIYVSYTFENSPGFNIAGPKTGRIVRLTVVGDTASESSKLILVGSVGGSAASPSCEDYAVTDDCIASDSNSHSVGGLRFGSDGKLYAALGDGADFSAIDPRALRAQNIDALAGKILRINTDGTAPSDNPFYDGNPNSNRSKVYALGLRNAFRFNFHPTTNLLYAGDVGWGSWEEVNRIVAGGNYGWPCREGNVATSYDCTPSSIHTNPLYTYAHNSSGAGSVIGGSFPSSSAYPTQYANSLFIGDYAQMWMKRLVLNASGTAVISIEDFIPDSVWPVEIITGPDGNIYYLDIVFGSLNRIIHTNGNRKPIVNISSNKNSGSTPLNVTFSSSGTQDPDGDSISYNWQFGDGAFSTLANPSHNFTSNGVFNTALTVTDQHGAENTKSIKIFAGNQAPVANITNPSSGSLYKPLENITVSGEGFDKEDGSLSPSALSWRVLLHHNTHIHTLTQAAGTSSVTFTADDHNSSDVYIEVVLTVTDSLGLSSTQSINMYFNNGAGSGNLISNPSLETEGSIPNSPLDWYQGWYGVMDPVFTYPATGLVGDKAVQIDVQSYTSGGAKWYFSPTFVTSGVQYTFSNIYTANVQTSIFAQYGKTDGTYQYELLASLPATITPIRNSINFTIPDGIQNVTVYQEINSVGQLKVDDHSLILTANNDVIPPDGNISNIVNNETISGVKIIEINATDNVGVASVRLVVNDIEVGVGDSESPYSVVWDTTSIPNGNHTLAALINDTSGNQVMTSALNVTVVNNVSSTTNLINNGDFEIIDGINPLGWQDASWGNHTRVLTYPVAGFNGGKAVEVKITNYEFGQTGDSKWGHTSVKVTPGTEYTYKTMYKSGSISDVIGRYTFSDGSVHYFGLIKEIPSIADWTSLSKSFVPPVGAVNVTLFHLISSETVLTIDNVELFETGTGTPAETNLPLIDFVSPQEGDILSGSVTLTATSSDDTGVVGVYFAVNGAPHGSEDPTAPYQYIWDTTKVPNGTYVLKATTHDPFGNNDKKEITVTVNNTSTIPPPNTNNLVVNSDLETSNGDSPVGWNRGGWGNNTRVLNYPVLGFAGNGVEVIVSDYVSGDAKWYFDPVAIVGGMTYTVSDQYKSTVDSEVLIRYTLTDGTFLYQFLSVLPNSNTSWQSFSQTVTAPANATHMTLFHIVAGNGSLVIDNVGVIGTSNDPTPDTTSPSVNITSPIDLANVSGDVNIFATVVDNVGVAGARLIINGAMVGVEDTIAPYGFTWDSKTVNNGTNTIAVLARDTSGNETTSVVVNVFVNNTIPPPNTNNLVVNSDLETSNGDSPVGWNRGGWGNNTRVLNYPVLGFAGNGVEVIVSDYVSGDAKWYFDPVAIVGGMTYTVSDQYKSTVDSEVLIRYTLTDGTFLYQFLSVLPNSNTSWQSFSQTVTAPANATHMTLFHIVAGNGSLVIDNVGVR